MIPQLTIQRAMRLTAILALLLSITIPASAQSALEKARQLKERTSARVDSLASGITTFNADSIGNTVVFETAAREEDDTDDEPFIDASNPVSNFLDNLDLIPILAVVLGIIVPFGAFVLVVYILVHGFNARRNMKYEAIARAAEAGHPLPPEFYRSENPAVKNKVQSGIVWIGWGMASGCLWLCNVGTIWLAIGIIAFFIGISRLVAYYLDNRNGSDNNAEQA